MTQGGRSGAGCSFLPSCLLHLRAFSRIKCTLHDLLLYEKKPAAPACLLVIAGNTIFLFLPSPPIFDILRTSCTTNARLETEILFLPTFFFRDSSDAAAPNYPGSTSSSRRPPPYAVVHWHHPISHALVLSLFFFLIGTNYSTSSSSSPFL